ncbi:MAG: BREX system Lon protease-like protein BrxL [Oscillochloridaceae bacterium umkhey_bin13]
MEFDALDQIAASNFAGYIVRKDLAQRFKGQYPVPTYVGEFLLGRYCASTDEAEIAEGLAVVERQMRERTVRSGEEELFKSRARERGSVKLIDLITARLDTTTDSYVATLPSLRLNDVRIDDTSVAAHERMLTGGFYAEVQLDYDAAIAQEKSGRPFGITSLRPIQLSKRGILEEMARGRASFTSEQWKDFLLRSIGFEPSKLSPRTRDVLLLRMVPFVERNYNMVELGPRGTGKSHLFQQVSPYAHLISGGKATVARMFVNNSTGPRGLVCQYDVVCFDEISGISFDQKDGVNIMKGYMESGEFSRGRESIRASGSLVLVGNFDVDVEHQQRIGHLFGPLPGEMRNDTAFMDRIHAYLPGWDVPKLDRSQQIIANAARETLGLPLADAAPQPETAGSAGARQQLNSSVLATLARFEAGLTPAEIAVERGLAEGTIYTHLAAGIRAGSATATRVVTPEMVQAVRDVIQSEDPPVSFTELRHRLSDHFTYGHLLCVIAAHPELLPEPRTLTPDEVHQACVAIRATVADLAGTLPRSSVIKLLIGSSSSRVADLRSHPAYGALTGFATTALWQIMNDLLTTGEIGLNEQSHLVYLGAPALHPVAQDSDGDQDVYE